MGTIAPRRVTLISGSLLPLSLYSHSFQNVSEKIRVPLRGQTYTFDKSGFIEICQKCRFDPGYERESIQEFRIDKGGVLTIGRDKANDIVVDNLGVSAFHAKLDSVDGRFMLTDLKSRNGTFVNDELITSRWIRHGDVIIIGKHILIFTYGQDEVRPPGDSPPKEETMVLRTDMHQEPLDRNYGKRDPERIDRKDVGALVSLEGGTGEVILENKLIKIGKDPLSDVFVGGVAGGKDRRHHKQQVFGLLPELRGCAGQTEG